MLASWLASWLARLAHHRANNKVKAAHMETLALRAAASESRIHCFWKSLFLFGV